MSEQDIGASGETDNTTSNNESGNSAATDGSTSNKNDQAGKAYTQAEVDDMMAKAKSAISFQATKKYQELGEFDQLKELVDKAKNAEQQSLVDKGKYEDALKHVVETKDATIAELSKELKELKINEPLLKAASTHRSINPEQTLKLLSPKVNMATDGSIEVYDDDGNIRYDESGKVLSVDSLVKEFLDANPHFQQAGKSTTNSNSSHGQGTTSKVDITKLDMKNPEHRKIYREHRKANGLR